MKSHKKAYTLTIIYDSKTGEIEYAEESVERLKIERISPKSLADIDDEDVKQALIESPKIGES